MNAKRGYVPLLNMQNELIDAALGTKEAVAIVDEVKEKIRSILLKM